MNMRAGTIAIGLVVAALSARAESNGDSPCPSLPATSGLTWTYSRGPDFGVCYAEKKGLPSAGLIGVYLGFHPSFTPTAATFVREGQLEGSVIRWHSKVPTDAEFQLGIETLHDLGRLTSHVWVMANDVQSLDALRIVAEGMSFKGGE